MLEIRLPIKKYQRMTTIAAVIGFLLGVAVPALAFMTGRWSCPFGSGVIRTGGFILLTGALSAALIGNLAALLLIVIAKFRQSASHRRPKN